NARPQRVDAMIAERGCSAGDEPCVEPAGGVPDQVNGVARLLAACDFRDEADGPPPDGSSRRGFDEVDARLASGVAHTLGKASLDVLEVRVGADLVEPEESRREVKAHRGHGRKRVLPANGARSHRNAFPLLCYSARPSARLRHVTRRGLRPASVMLLGAAFG